MEVAQSLDRMATPEEVGQAFEALPEEDLLRLWKAASYCLLGSEYSDPDELINEVVFRTLNGDRHWPKNIPFMAYFIQTMKGLGNDSYHSVDQSRFKQLESIAPEGGSVDDALGKLEHFHPDALTNAILVEKDQERRERETAALTRIEAHFADNDEVTWVFLGHKDGMTAAEIREVSGMTQTQYDSAMRRFRRGIEKVFSEKRKP